jgi:hypothetical protein
LALLVDPGRLGDLVGGHHLSIAVIVAVKTFNDLGDRNLILICPLASSQLLAPDGQRPAVLLNRRRPLLTAAAVLAHCDTRRPARTR